MDKFANHIIYTIFFGNHMEIFCNCIFLVRAFLFAKLLEIIANQIFRFTNFRYLLFYGLQFVSHLLSFFLIFFKI